MTLPLNWLCAYLHTWLIRCDPIKTCHCITISAFFMFKLVTYFSLIWVPVNIQWNTKIWISVGNILIWSQFLVASIKFYSSSTSHNHGIKLWYYVFVASTVNLAVVNIYTKYRAVVLFVVRWSGLQNKQLQQVPYCRQSNQKTKIMLIFCLSTHVI